MCRYCCGLVLSVMIVTFPSFSISATKSKREKTNIIRFDLLYCRLDSPISKIAEYVNFFTNNDRIIERRWTSWCCTLSIWIGHIPIDRRCMRSMWKHKKTATKTTAQQTNHVFQRFFFYEPRAHGMDLVYLCLFIFLRFFCSRSIAFDSHK